MPLPDPAASRAVIIGVDAYESKTMGALPTVAATIKRLTELFTDPALWELPREHCVVLPNPKESAEVIDTVRTAAQAATDTFLLYFAGHGLPSRSGGLRLMLPQGDSDRLHHAVRYDDLRHELLNECDAPNKVVIIDCCFSGTAIIQYMGGPDDVADRMAVDSTYVLTACPAEKKAFAPSDEKYTAFTGELIRTLETGVPGGPDPLHMDTIYRHVRQALLARGRPEPQQRSTGVGHEIALVRNAAAGVPAGSTPRRAVRRRTWRRRHTWVAAAVALPVAGFLSLPLFFPDESDEPSPFGRTVDPCSLIRPADFARFGDTELDRAYGNFDRCDVLVHRADGGVVDVKVDLDNGQPETTTGATTEGHVRILREPAESDNCTRLLLPAGTDAMVSVSAKLAEDGSAPLCDIADQATERAVSVLNKGLLTPRSDFPAGSLAHEKACALLDAKALETVPGIDADDPDEGYGNFSCDWHSTTSDLDVELRFDRGQPLSAADGTLTRIEGRRALIQPAGEGEDTCLVRVEQRTFRNDQTRTQAETLNLFVAGDRSEAELCRMATALATAGAARVPRA